VNRLPLLLVALASAASAAPRTPRGDLRWDVGRGGGEGVALILSDALRAPVLRLACVREPPRMVVAAYGLRPTGEAQLTLAIDETPFVFAKTAAPSGPGLTAEGPIPPELPARLAAGRTLRLVYAGRTLGPWSAPPAEVAREFAAGCRDVAAGRG
jgi:hypothetical protein